MRSPGFRLFREKSVALLYFRFFGEKVPLVLWGSGRNACRPVFSAGAEGIRKAGARDRESRRLRFRRIKYFLLYSRRGVSVKQIAKDGGKTGLCEGSDKGKRWHGAAGGGLAAAKRKSSTGLRLTKFLRFCIMKKQKTGRPWFLRRGLSCVVAVRVQACGKGSSLWAEG